MIMFSASDWGRTGSTALLVHAWCVMDGCDRSLSSHRSSLYLPPYPSSHAFNPAPHTEVTDVCCCAHSLQCVGISAAECVVSGASMGFWHSSISYAEARVIFSKVLKRDSEMKESNARLLRFSTGSWTFYRPSAVKHKQRPACSSDDPQMRGWEAKIGDQKFR